MHWQTIDTAPKDGRDIIVWDERFNAVCIAFYIFDRWDDGYQQVNPTHWMPIPDRPGLTAPKVSWSGYDPLSSGIDL
jgi:hypothetical protein